MPSTDAHARRVASTLRRGRAGRRYLTLIRGLTVGDANDAGRLQLEPDQRTLSIDIANDGPETHRERPRLEDRTDLPCEQLHGPAHHVVVLDEPEHVEWPANLSRLSVGLPKRVTPLRVRIVSVAPVDELPAVFDLWFFRQQLRSADDAADAAVHVNVERQRRIESGARARNSAGGTLCIERSRVDGVLLVNRPACTRQWCTGHAHKLQAWLRGHLRTLCERWCRFGIRNFGHLGPGLAY